MAVLTREVGVALRMFVIALQIINTRTRRMGKVMFSQVWVRPQGEWGYLPWPLDGGGVPPVQVRYTPSGQVRTGGGVPQGRYPLSKVGTPGQVMMGYPKIGTPHPS